LRAFIAAVEALPSFDGDGSEQRAQWLSWAGAKADELDPLSIEPHNVLDVDFEGLARLEVLTRT
jgi:hypothetical protein